eukprot:TRINITY_DN4379_c0_g2_i1.p1 TRINITY_DN4379_c0_g2~~TRINITY_DN4379_c0_g2_i1.p1  ORF type:complete len:254 (-),score=48.16 TRINITY_DN4379_c0_g2_i1:84-845(-)
MGRCLLSFDCFGCGTVCRRETCRPWFTVDEKGATVYKEDGSIERSMLWRSPPWHKGMEDPPSKVHPMILRLNQRLVLDFKDRTHNMLIFFCEGEYKYQVGWRLKREHIYTEEADDVIKNGPERGKYVVNQAARHLKAANLVGEKARHKYTVAGKVPGLVELMEKNEQLAHYLKTTETMRVSPAVTHPQLNAAIASLFPQPLHGGQLGVERAAAEAQVRMGSSSRKTALHTMNCSRRIIPAIGNNYQEVRLGLA